MRIADLGRVEIGAASERSTVRFNGRSAVARRHQAGRRPIPWNCRRPCAPICPRSSPSCRPACGRHCLRLVDLHRPFSIEAVFKTIGEAILLVLAIIFFFLRNFRAT